MKQVLIRKGRVVVEEMPAPRCGPGELLVRTAFSLISAGTELAGLQASAAAGTPPWAHRMKKAGEVARLVTQRGVADARAAVAARLEGPSDVTGYSLAGTLLEVGSAVGDLVPGQRVACAGAASAHHGEIVAVPRKLVVPVPAGLPLDQAATVTLGAIALQGVRRAEVRLGEIACVVGLGMIGQLTAALLQAAGCRVVAADLDAARVDRARSLGIEAGVVGAGAELEQAVHHAGAGRGADVVLVTASSPSSEPLRQAVRLLRRRGRVVVVGAVGMDLERAPFYEKDVELKIACSYGPGRYDPAYERDGHDYPYEFVRWTENRNMQEYLRLAAAGRIPVGSLIDRTFDVADAPSAFEALEAEAEAAPLGVLLRYPEAGADEPAAAAARIDVVPRTRRDRRLGVAIVGPGQFAREVHLPNLGRLGERATLRAVVGRTANAAREAARRFAAEYAATDLDEVLGDDGVDLVLLCTRHDLHARQAIAALRAGKAVFCEKPAAVDASQLAELDAVARSASARITVGFNRRFAPLAVELRRLLEQRNGPLVIDYRVNAGSLPRGHWLSGAEGGGRLIGEGCHMVDLLAFLVGQPVVRHELQLLAPPAGRDDLAAGDNFSLGLRHADGSLSTLTYTSLGHAALGKERLECHWDGRSAVLDDFRRLTVAGIDGADRALDPADKGHAALLARFVEHVAGEQPAPIPWDEILTTSRLVLQLDRLARGADAS
jgi:predicted dehydrogenase/threonine dehydrogenase-like Zn-dependent dehydrogenase